MRRDFYIWCVAYKNKLLVDPFEEVEEIKNKKWLIKNKNKNFICQIDF